MSDARMSETTREGFEMHAANKVVAREKAVRPTSPVVEISSLGMFVAERAGRACAFHTAMLRDAP